MDYRSKKKKNLRLAVFTTDLEYRSIPSLSLRLIGAELAWSYLGSPARKRQRTGALQNASLGCKALKFAPASWSAAALRRFSSNEIIKPMVHARVPPLQS
jgi:hypothetical protein